MNYDSSIGLSIIQCEITEFHISRVSIVDNVE